MATEFKDGTFSETKPFDEAIQDFQQHAATGLAKAFHVGTVKEIEEVKNKKSVEEQLKDLQARLSAVEAKESLQAKGIILPTSEDIQRIG